MILRTASVTSHSSVLMCTSGLSGASYGAEMPVKSLHSSSASLSSPFRRYGRTLDLARSCLLVESLRVALLNDGERRVDEDLDEREPCLLVQFARDGTVCPVWADEGGQADARGVREELRDL